MFAEILKVLDREHLRLSIVDRDKLGAVERVTFTISASSSRHARLLAELNASGATQKVVSFRDEEEE
jgi:putative Mg2+ transporter-C (MgtC) family protein